MHPSAITLECSSLSVEVVSTARVLGCGLARCLWTVLSSAHLLICRLTKTAVGVLAGIKQAVGVISNESGIVGVRSHCAQSIAMTSQTIVSASTEWDRMSPVT
jgi:hypothetical protein